ncbi:hypothetical protein [Haloarcula sp. 1CSR25-25]|uniref:hypothetical protein n=1 Tax=Haloarcula sp. 1CSR25-25 TaxID=2862545 RepID=UPI0028958613|nr:hypothetical protein [Haloarcula sp. 1CSR25-25]MDT3434672.1 hypothetical protein [Haloarcula sp. 1CSR25-25]
MDVVEGFRKLIEVEPEAASARLDSVAETVESSRAARTKFVDAVADLIVALPSEGARYPAQVLADLVLDDAMDVREKACETAGELAAALGQSHIRQCKSLFAATVQRVGTDDHEFVREQAGAACLTLALGPGGIDLPAAAMVIAVLQQTLPRRAATAFERAAERLQTAKVPVTPVPTTR